MKKIFNKDVLFALTIAVFIIACVVITVFTVKREPQYIEVIARPNASANASDNSDNSEIISEILEASENSEPSKININTASASELQTLSGIGEVIAGRIIAYREENGGFDSVEEIMEVSGIGEKMFENIKEKISVE